MRFIVCCAAVATLAASGPAFATTDFEVGPRLLDSTGLAGDTLGFSIAGLPVSDGSQLAAAGALGGYVAILKRQTGQTQFTISQRTSSGVADDSYGLSVALGGVDGEYLAVGAPGDDAFGNNAGRVYLLRRSSTAADYLPLATLDPPAPAVTANFGTAVTIADDGSFLVVGEPKGRSGGIEVGLVHIYPLNGASVGLPMTQVGALGMEARFGQSVATHGTRVVVGAPLADDPMMLADTGAIQVLTITAGIPSPDGPALFAADRAAEDRLGLSVDIEGDVLIAGAGNDDKLAGGDAGSAYVFRRVGGNWQEEDKLRSISAQAQERFGQSVALNGDLAMVGAYCLNVSGCVGPGAVYLFAHAAGSWTGKQPLGAADANSFGHAVAWTGTDSMVIGAFGTDATFQDQGAVYAAFPTDQLLVDGFE
ncbi:MAG: hypothetical protein KDI48_09965 [Xanthomonadales bacterium]|nr:hypothetical protein [Xanthomonadales bacterium]